FIQRANKNIPSFGSRNVVNQHDSVGLIVVGQAAETPREGRPGKHVPFGCDSADPKGAFARRLQMAAGNDIAVIQLQGIECDGEVCFMNDGLRGYLSIQAKLQEETFVPRPADRQQIPTGRYPELAKEQVAVRSFDNLVDDNLAGAAAEDHKRELTAL